MKSAKILFAGTPVFAVPALEALLDAGYRVSTVYTQPDRPAGRGRRLQPSPVKEIALQRGLRVEQPERLATVKVQQQLVAEHMDLMLVVAYGQILPQSVLDLPRYGCLNVHASLLPRWRGAAPVQRSLLAGDVHTGVSIMHMEAGLDTGPVWLRKTTDIKHSDTAGDLHNRLAHLGATALLEALPLVLSGTQQPEPQDETQATYANKLTKEEARLDWALPAVRLVLQVRAFNPWPVAFTFLGDESMRIWRASTEDSDSSAAPGQVLMTDREGIRVQTGDGVLLIQELQPAGKRIMLASDYLNAHDLKGRSFR